MTTEKIKQKPSVLVTEDDVENQKFLQLILKREFEVDICDSETSFRERLLEKDYDVLIMDISLKGGRDGIEIIKDLRKKNKYKNLPVVCLSAHIFSQDKMKARDAGVDAYLTKPVDNHLLIRTLKKFADGNRDDNH